MERLERFERLEMDGGTQKIVGANCSNNVADYQLSVVIMVLLVDYLTLVLIVVVWMYESVW